jgi:hypothetical protein
MEQGFELRNVESDLSLDIEGYRTEGGTRAVLYDPTGYKNQRFYFTRSAASLTAFAIAAVHTANRCLTATTDGQIQIWECQRGTNQLWRVALADCE